MSIRIISLERFLDNRPGMAYTASCGSRVRFEVVTDVVVSQGDEQSNWCEFMQKADYRPVRPSQGPFERYTPKSGLFESGQPETAPATIAQSGILGPSLPSRFSAFQSGQIPTRFFCRVTAFIGSLIALLIVLCLPINSFAQQTSIGFVDIPYLIDKAPQAADAELRLETEFAPRQLELEAQRERLEEIRLRLKTQALELSELDRGNLERDARGLERRLKRDELDFREELNIQKNNEFRKVRILVLEAIARFGKANDYDLIVSDGVLYADKSIDVTEKILEQLVKSNRALQSSN